MFVFIVFESVEHITVSFCIKVNIEYNFEKADQEKSCRGIIA